MSHFKARFQASDGNHVGLGTNINSSFLYPTVQQ